MMLKLSLRDLIIRLDEQRKVFQMFVPKRHGSTDELQLFYEVSESDILSDEAVEDEIGKLILAYLSARYTSNLFRLDHYRTAAKEFAESIDVQSSSLLASGDADSEFEGAMLRIRSFDESWTLGDVDGITALMEHASNRGSKEATVFLREKWPTNAAIFKKRIQRRQKEGGTHTVLSDE
jgi:hypothetical protein